MTNETTPEQTPFSQQEVKDFKGYYGQAMGGILASLPFGVTVDPAHLVTVARNVATAMVHAQREHLPDELHEDEKSNFPEVKITKDDVHRVINALIAQDKGLAANVLAQFGVASVDKLHSATYPAVYAMAFSKLAR